MEVIAYGIALVIALWAGHDITKKSEVYLIEDGQVVRSVKINSPAKIVILRNGDEIEIRSAKRGDLPK